jgi:hypothetical protein
MPVWTLVDHRDRDVADIGVDGIAEQDQLDQRDHDDHAEGHPVAAQLGQFLEKTARCARKRSHWRPSPVAVTKTSSRLGRTVRSIVARRSAGWPSGSPPDRRCVFDEHPQRALQAGRRHDALAAQKRRRISAQVRPSISTTLAPMAAISAWACRRPLLTGFHDRDLVAALGLVHEMGGHNNRGAAIDEVEKLLPEMPARFRVDRRGRLVQEQQLRFVQHGRRQGPGAGAGRRSSCRRTGPELRQFIAVHHFADPLFRFWARERP